MPKVPSPTLGNARPATVAVVVASAALSVVFSAFQAPRWMGWISVGIFGAALVVLLFQIPFVTRRIHWELRRKDPEYERGIKLIARRELLRKDLRIALGSLNAMEKPSPPELRAWADNLARRLRDDGFDMTAKEMEVHLPDNVDEAAIDARKSDLSVQLMRMLIWDEFA